MMAKQGATVNASNEDVTLPYIPVPPAGTTLATMEVDQTQIKQIGKYPIVRFLGKGAMGRVYLGQHPELQLPVAIKVIDAKHASDERYRRLFIQEARLASQINHPNVIRIYDADQEGQICFMVQEYVDGGDVAALIRSVPSGGMDTGEALRIAAGVASGLVAAEKLQIVHRDVKPSNILLTRGREPKLADLGLARQSRGASDAPPAEGSLSTPGSTIGTPAYMAPEQIRSPSKIDNRADIYSLGATLFEMLTGHPPFTGKTTDAVLDGHLNEPVPDPRGLNPKLSRRVAQVVVKMLAKRPEDRQPTAAALLRDLERVRQPRWRPAVLGGVAAGVLGLVAISVLVAQRGSGQDAGLGVAEGHLSRGEIEQALPRLEAVLQRRPGDERVLYAIGLCGISRREPQRVADARAALATSAAGAELAQHLEVLSLLEGGDDAQVLRLTEEALRQCRYPLLFLYAQGLVHLRRRDSARAEQALSAAATAAAPFEFQRLAAVDTLAKLLVAQGRAQEANAVYERGLQGITGGMGPPAEFRINQVVALVNAGKPGDAAEPLRLALELAPNDELGLYLRRTLAEAGGAAEQEAIQRTMAMIGEVAALLGKRAQAADQWTSTPAIIAFLPAVDTDPVPGRLGTASFWVESLAEAVRQRGPFPVVNRSALDRILREQQLSASELAEPAGRLRLGTLLPASILIGSRFGEDGGVHLDLELVDASTSEVIRCLSRDGLTAAGRLQAVETLAAEVVRCLAERAPVRGRVTAVQGDEAEINIGRSHGLGEKDVLAVLRPQDGASPRQLARQAPLAQASVAGLDRFTATVRLQAPREPVTVGMLVQVAPAQ